MPSLNAGDVPHTSQTDHRILANPFRDQPSLNGEIVLFEAEKFPIPADEVRRAHGLALASVASNSNIPQLAGVAIQELMESLDRDDQDIQVLDAVSALLAVSNPKLAIEIGARGHELAPQNESLLETLAIAF